MFYDTERGMGGFRQRIYGRLPKSHAPRVLRHHDPEPGPRSRGRHPGGPAGPGRHGLHSGRKLSASDLQLVLLALLSEKPAHGYELIKSLEERSDGFYIPSPGVIYPALTYLTEIGFTAFEAEGSKKLYQLTEAGQNHFVVNRVAATRILDELERIGGQMVYARQALTRSSEPGQDIEIASGDDGSIRDEIEAIRREVRRAQRENGPLTPEETRRIAGILDRAAAEIRLGQHLSQQATPTQQIHPPHHAHVSYLARLAGLHSGPEGKRPMTPDAEKELGAFVSPAQADFIYLLCRALGATRVAESTTSIGLSAMYLASAVRDNGGGVVIGSESVPEKARTARRNLSEAGLGGFVEVREGDAGETLRDLGGLIDLLLISSKTVSQDEPGGSTARQILDVVVPQMRMGSVVLTADGEPGYLAYLRDPSNGFCSMPLPFVETMELSVRVI
jgi:DNA-binding PadR family transcriptional regulator/predicted O-methyltransferase YrrM